MATRRHVLAAAIALAAGRGGARAAELAWEQGAPIPAARSELGAAVIDGAIYIAGGFGSGSRVDRFEPADGAWVRIPDMPAAVHHPGVAALDGRLIVAGGYDETRHTATAAVWSYDPDAVRWSPLPDLPAPRGAHGLAVIDGLLYAAGGAFEKLGGPVSGDLWRFDPESGAWEALAPLPTSREHLAVVALGGRLYAIGGRADGEETDALAGANQVYDPVTDAWGSLAPLPVPRGGLSGVALGEAVVVLGGERGKHLFANADRYRPATDAWDALPPMPTARHGLAAAAIDGAIYAITGSVLAGGVENTAVTEFLRPEAA